MKHILSVLWVVVLAVIIALPTGITQAYSSNTHPLNAAGQTLTPNQAASAQPTCHFGIAVLDNLHSPWAGVDLSTLGAGSYLDWGHVGIMPAAANVNYLRVINLFDASYNQVKAALPGWIKTWPGSTWLIGNEPDSETSDQNHISAGTYAQRYFELATIIRKQDPSAKIAFGQIMQPSPMRLYYLTLAMNRLAQLAGGLAQAHALIDIYSLHDYMLNELPIYGPDGKMQNWGAGVPIGYDAATWPAPEEIHPERGETYKVYDINLFKTHIIAFRQWVADQGEQNKPVYITEFGVLFPPEGNPYLYASDEETANFMDQAYDFMLGYKDSKIGFAGDDFRLVQNWIWFSLNDVRTQYGGSLYNPLNHQVTTVGERFVQYDPSPDIVPPQAADVYVLPGSLDVKGLANVTTADQVYYKASVKIGNHVSSDRLAGVQVNLYDGGTLVSTNQVELPRCGGTIQVSFLFKGQLAPMAHDFSASVELLPGNGADSNPDNNQVTFSSLALPSTVESLPPVAYFPVVLK